MPQGKLIVIEGGDGSGKKTQTAMLVGRLKQDGQPVETIDFPQCQNNFYGQIIRAYLDGQFGQPTAIKPELAGVLYCLDRFESKEKINQWLAEGKIIISDRFHTANTIHQGAKTDGEARDRLIAFLDELEFGLLRVPRPDLVIYLHVFPAVADMMMEKQGRIKDGHETDPAYVKKVEATALWATEKFGWKKIECCPDKNSIFTPEEIHEKIWQVAKQAV